MQKIKLQFTNSFKELKNLKSLTITAMLIALGFVLGFFTIQPTSSLKIGFGFLPNALAGFFFGPVVGAIMGGIGDIVGYIAKPTGPFFLPFTFNAMLGPLLYGIFLYQRPLRLRNVILAKLSVTLIVNLILNTYFISLLQGKAFLVLLPARALKQVLMFPIETFLLFALLKGLSVTPLSKYFHSTTVSE